MPDIRLAVDVTRLDPKDTAIQRLLDKGEWQPALRIVELQNRKDKSDKVFINKYLIKIVWLNNICQRMEAVRLLERLLMNANPPVTKLGLLTAIELSLPEIVSKWRPQMLYNMWERASIARPDDPLLLDSWYTHSRRRLDFAASRKIALKAFKIVKDKHLLRWRAIVSCHLDAQYGRDLLVAKVSHGLALALVKSSLEAVPTADTDGSKKKSVNKIDPTLPSIQSTSELRTALLIYDTHNMDDERAALLDSDTVGLRSLMNKGIWRLALDRLAILRKQDNCAEGWKFCYRLLCEAANISPDDDKKASYGFGKMGDDMTVWRNATEDVYTLRDPAIFSKFQVLLDNLQLSERHRLLAKIALCVAIKKEGNPFPDYEASTTRAVEDYFKEYFGHTFVYDDLRAVLGNHFYDAHIDLTEQTRKMHPGGRRTVSNTEAEYRTWITKHLTDLKLKYTLIIATEENRKDVDRLETFAALCCGTYIGSLQFEIKLAITERRAGDDAAILCACALLHLASNGKSSMKLRAMLILETLLENSPHNYGAMVMLIRLYLGHGCWRLAAALYPRLDIKAIQLFSDAWIMTTRASSLFPYRMRKPNKDLGDLLTRVAKYADSKSHACRQLIKSYNSEQNPIGLCDAHMFLQSCLTSLSRAATLAELSRYNYRNCIGECFGQETVLSSASNIENKDREDGYVETASLKGFPDYEPVDAPSIATLLNTGPMPNQVWVEVEELLFQWRRWTQKKEWWQYSPQGHMVRAAEYHGRLMMLIKSLEEPGVLPGLTSQERWVAVIITSMTSVQSAAMSLRGDLSFIKEADKETKDGWLKAQYPKYERSFRSFLVLTKRFLEVALFEEAGFIKTPFKTFYECPWVVLHTYYKLTEILMFVPSLMLELIKFAGELRNALSGATLSLDDDDTTKMLDVAFLEQFLRDFLKAATLMIKNWNLAAKKTQMFYRDSVSIVDFIIQVEGHDGSIRNPSLMKNLDHLFRRQWTQNRALQVAQNWQEALGGIALEDLHHWHTKRWPKEAEKYMETQ